MSIRNSSPTGYPPLPPPSLLSHSHLVSPTLALASSVPYTHTGFTSTARAASLRPRAGPTPRASLRCRSPILACERGPRNGDMSLAGAVTDRRATANVGGTHRRNVSRDAPTGTTGARALRRICEGRDKGAAADAGGRCRSGDAHEDVGVSADAEVHGRRVLDRNLPVRVQLLPQAPPPPPPPPPPRLLRVAGLRLRAMLRAKQHVHTAVVVCRHPAHGPVASRRTRAVCRETSGGRARRRAARDASGALSTPRSRGPP